VIETARGVEEFDARDRALVWRTVGGKHRYLLGDCAMLVDDDIDAFRAALTACIEEARPLTLESVTREQALLSRRRERFGDCADGYDIWRALGWEDPGNVPMLDTAAFLQQAHARAAR
jgi:malonate decarboxylase beta subunit